MQFDYSDDSNEEHLTTRLREPGPRNNLPGPIGHRAVITNTYGTASFIPLKSFNSRELL